MGRLVPCGRPGAVVAGGAVAQFAYVHARAEADVLAPVQGTDIVFGIKSG